MDDATLTVGQLAARLDAMLQQAFPTEVWIRGEVQDLSRRSGNAYFSLVDEEAAGRAKVPVVLLAANRRAVNNYLMRHGGVRMEDGTTVRIRAAVTYYAPQGRLQLRMTWIDPDYTLGRLAAERERLLRTLAAEGLLDTNRSLPMPAAPLAIGLVTAAGSAAAADFLDELRAAGYGWRIAHADARVQGPDAARSLVAGLRAVVAAGVEVVAIVRGGGARSELAAFDDETLARAVAAAPVPVVTGIGHEIDRSVVDEVAHVAFKTPTACAAGLAEVVRVYLERVETAWAGIGAGAERAFEVAAGRLAAASGGVAAATRSVVAASLADTALAAARMRRAAPAVLATEAAGLARSAGALEAAGLAGLRRHDDALRVAARRLAAGAPRPGARAASQLDTARSRLRALDPSRILARGWTLTCAADGRIVRSAAALDVGAEITTRFPDGSVDSTVHDVQPTPTPADD